MGLQLWILVFPCLTKQIAYIVHLDLKSYSGAKQEIYLGGEREVYLTDSMESTVILYGSFLEQFCSENLNSLETYCMLLNGFQFTETKQVH